MNLKKQAVSSIFWSSIQQFGTQGISFIVSIILARALLPAEFGLIAMLTIFISLGTSLVDSGLTQSLIRTRDLDEDDYSTVFYFNLAGSVVVYLIAFFLAPFISRFYNQALLTPILRLYTVTFVINAFAAIQNTRLIKKMDFKTQTKVAIPSLILGSTVGLILAFNNYGVWSLVWSNIAQSLAMTMQLIFWSKWIPGFVFNLKKFKHHFHFGMKLMFSGVLDIIYTNIYTIVIGKFFAPSQLGYYNRADTLQMLPVGNLNAIITKVSFPLFSSIQNDDIKLKIVYKKIMQMVLFVITPTLVLMGVMAEPMFRLLFTDKWLPAVPYFQILCINGILYPIHSYNLQILNVKGRSDLFLKLEVIKKILGVAVIIVSFQYGIFGLLYGSVITSILCFFINTHYGGRFLDYPSWEQIKDIVPILLLSFLLGFSGHVLDNILKNHQFPDLFRLLIGGFIGVILYLSMAYIFKMSTLNEIIKLIKNR